MMTKAVVHVAPGQQLKVELDVPAEARQHLKDLLVMLMDIVEDPDQEPDETHETISECRTLLGKMLAAIAVNSRRVLEVRDEMVEDEVRDAIFSKVEAWLTEGSRDLSTVTVALNSSDVLFPATSGEEAR